MVTDKCIGTGLPWSVAGRYFHWRSASTAACCRGAGPETGVAEVTLPVTSITAFTRTSPSRCWFFAINGYSGKTVDIGIGCVDAAADWLFVCAILRVGEAKVTCPRIGACPKMASCGGDWDTPAEAGEWFTGAVSLLRAGLEVLRKYHPPPTARTRKTSGNSDE